MKNKPKEKGQKYQVRQQRFFSEAFRKARVDELIKGQITVSEISHLYKVSRSAVYKWLYRYSHHHSKGTNQIVEMKSESMKTKILQEKVADLERTIGQKQLDIDYLEKLVELASDELGYDVKKNLEPRRSSGSENTTGNMTTR